MSTLAPSRRGLPGDAPRAGLQAAPERPPARRLRRLPASAPGRHAVTTELALAWATQPSAARSRSRWETRLGVVRGFARYLQTDRPGHRGPARAACCPAGASRPTPYLYCADRDRRADRRRPTAARRRCARRPTEALIGLLAVTGHARSARRSRWTATTSTSPRGCSRSGEAKFGQSRQVPLHPTTADGAARLRRTPRPALPAPATRTASSSPASAPGCIHNGVRHTFSQLRRGRLGLAPRPSAPPRSRSAAQLRRAHPDRLAPRRASTSHARLPVLSTYLGHVNPAGTYWYLQAAPELLRLAAAAPRTLDLRSTAMSALAPTLQAFFTDRLHGPAPGQPAHHRRLPRHLPAAARASPQQRTGTPALRARPRRPRRRADRRVPGPPRDRARQQRRAPATHRLAAIHSLFGYAALHHPEHAASIARVLAIPPKRVRTHPRHLPHRRRGRRAARRPRPDHLDRPPRPRAAARLADPDRAARLRADRPDLRRRHPRRRRARPLPGQGPQRTRHPADRRRPSTSCASGWPNAPASPTDPLFPTSRGGPLSRDAIAGCSPSTSRPPPPACPSLRTKTVIAAHPAPHRRDAPAARRRRHHRDRALARPRAGTQTTQIYLHADLALKGTSARPHHPTQHARPGRYRATRPAARLPRGAVIMPSTRARSPR